MLKLCGYRIAEDMRLCTLGARIYESTTPMCSNQLKIKSPSQEMFSVTLLVQVLS